MMKCGSGYYLITPYLLCHKVVVIIGWNWHGFYQGERQGRSRVFEKNPLGTSEYTETQLSRNI